MKNLHEEVPFSQNQRGNFRECSSKLVKQLKNVDEQVCGVNLYLSFSFSCSYYCLNQQYFPVSQVSSTLDFLKERYSFCTDEIRHSELDNNTSGLPGNPVSLEHSAFLGQDVASCVAEIYNTSMQTARKMVNVEVCLHFHVFL